MLKRILEIALLAGLVLGPSALAVAKDYNTKRPYLPPAGQVKVNNARAQLFVIQGQIERQSKDAEKEGDKASCFDRQSGVFVDRSNPRREVIIATRDIVNLGGRLDLGSSCR